MLKEPYTYALGSIRSYGDLRNTDYVERMKQVTPVFVVQVNPKNPLKDC